MDGKIFLNYRRNSSEAWADRLHDCLSDQLPDAEIFIDIDGDIPLGLPWAAWIENEVGECDLMLTLIGQTWAADFKSRSDVGSPDYVLAEIRSALKRKVLVVPVLLGDAVMPPRADLPEPIREIADLQAARLRRASNFEADVRVLIEGVGRSLRLRTKPTATTEKPSLSAFRREFWSHMLKRHPSEGDYRKRYAASSRWREMPDHKLVVVQYLSVNGAGVFIRCPRGGDDDDSVAALQPRAAPLEQVLSAPMNLRYPRFLFHKKFERDAFDKKHWDDMADWLHDEADRYVDAIKEYVSLGD